MRETAGNGGFSRLRGALVGHIWATSSGPGCSCRRLRAAEAVVDAPHLGCHSRCSYLVEGGGMSVAHARGFSASCWQRVSSSPLAPRWQCPRAAAWSARRRPAPSTTRVRQRPGWCLRASPRPSSTSSGRRAGVSPRGGPPGRFRRQGRPRAGDGRVDARRDAEHARRRQGHRRLTPSRSPSPAP